MPKTLTLGLVFASAGLQELVQADFKDSFDAICLPGETGADVIGQLESKQVDLLLLEQGKERDVSLLAQIKAHRILGPRPILFIGSSSAVEGLGALWDERRDFLLPPTYGKHDLVSCLKKLHYLGLLEEKGRYQEEREMALAKWTFLGKILSGIIHDINNPLTVVGLNSGLVNMLLEKKEWKEEYWEKIRKFSREVESGLQRANEILSNVRSFIITGVGRDRRTELATTPMRTILETGIKMCETEIKRHRVELTTVYGPETEDFCVHGDKNKLAEALMYLLLDSAEELASNESGTPKWIKVESSFTSFAHGKTFQLSISHSGEGPHGGDSPFRGVGITLARQFIEDHHGHLVGRNGRNRPSPSWVIQLPNSN